MKFCNQCGAAVEFTVPDFGMAGYKLTIATDGTLLSSGAFMPAESNVVEGNLALGGGPLDLACIEFAVPAGVEGELFELDNVRVVSPGLAPLHIK